MFLRQNFIKIYASCHIFWLGLWQWQDDNQVLATVRSHGTLFCNVSDFHSCSALVSSDISFRRCFYFVFFSLPNKAISYISLLARYQPSVSRPCVLLLLLLLLFLLLMLLLLLLVLLLLIRDHSVELNYWKIFKISGYN